MNQNEYWRQRLYTGKRLGKNVYQYARENHERWGVMAPDESMDGNLTDFEVLANKCLEPTRSRVDTLDKNTARKKCEKDLRGYLQGMVMHNINVTDHDREMMVLPLRDTIPTPVGAPVGMVTATVKYPNPCAIELHIEHVDGTPFDKRANYGVKIRYGKGAVGEHAPTAAEHLAETVFTRRKKFLFTYAQEDARKVAYFCLRYENSKRQAGQWGHIIDAIIP